jgi:YD repeat-containing protein
MRQPRPSTNHHTHGRRTSSSRSGTGWAASALSNQNAADTLIPVLDRGTLVGYSYKVFDTDAVELYDLTGKLVSITERNGWRTLLTYSTAATPAATAPMAGLLIQVSNHFGRSIKLAYNASKQLVRVTDPMGQSVQYAYNSTSSADAMLTTVTRQDNKTRQYHYEQANTPWGMTGITDEAGIRYATYGYDAQGRVSSESKVGNVDVAAISYSPTAGDYTTTVQNISPSGSLLSQTTIGFSQQGGRYQPTGSNAPSALCSGYAQSINYDTAGRKANEQTHEGKHIVYTYDTKGRTLSRTERTGSATGAITYKATTAYHPTFNLPTLTTEPNKRVAISYDAKGNVLGYVDYTTSDATGVLGLSAPIVSSQSTGWAFNTQQLPVLALYTETKYTNNRATSTSAPSFFLFNYDSLGNLGQFTQLINGKVETGKLTSYNANGAFLTGTSTTNQAVKHTYTPRGQLASTTVAGQVTTYTYDAIGQSKQVAYPNGDKLVYTYDAAHKLQSIKWNGTEQYTPTAGISSNLAAMATLGGYSGISNPELAHKLGVNASTLDTLDAAPKVLTQASNAAAFAAVELAKEAVIGKEARAAVPLIILGVVELGGASQAVLGIGAGIGLAAIIDNLTSPKVGDKSRICLPGKDPDDCQKLYDAYQKAKKEASAVGGCGNQTLSAADKKFRKPYWEKAARTREAHHNLCFDGGDKNHADKVQELWRAVGNCS